MKRICLRRVHFALLLFCTVHIPVSFSCKMPGDMRKMSCLQYEGSQGLAYRAGVLYDSLHLNWLGLSREAYHYGLAGLDKLRRSGEILNDGILSIADFSCPSSKKRLFVIDLNHRKLLFNTYVAHGQGSGEVYARHFSNQPSSLKSSLGFYETAETYYGRHGYSLKLEGLENGINNKASERAIVLHAAPYVNESYIRHRGYPGRSLGCPAVPERWNRPIIEKIKNGTCLFIYGNDRRYINSSPVLNS